MQKKSLLSEICPEHVTDEQLSETIDAILEKLTEREKYVVRHYYGIGETSISLAKIGVKMGVHESRIRQILAKALRKLKKQCMILFEINSKQNFKVY
jgi:RNA polymerase sigma factor (sigma-70 family)